MRIMGKRLGIIAAFAAAAAGWWPLDVVVAQERPAAPPKNLSDVAPPPPGLPRLTLTSNGHSIHIMPTVKGAAALAKAALVATGPLVYHSGGSIMETATFFPIFWIPAALQNGGATSMSPAYARLQLRLLADYTFHGLGNNNTQYYQDIGPRKYVVNAGGFGDGAEDTLPYPASGCTDTLTPGNCITDAQIQAEIKKVMNKRGWTGGPDKIFLLYTSSKEGSCFTDSKGKISCAYTDYCGYHSFIRGSPPIIYANIPFGDPSTCQVPGTPSPNNDPAADTAITAASHEIAEAITDPLLNAWFTDPSPGNEIADLCKFGTFGDYGPNTWDAGNGKGKDANQMWNGNFYELQQEFDNHAVGVFNSVGACVQVGP